MLHFLWLSVGTLLTNYTCIVYKPITAASVKAILRSMVAIVMLAGLSGCSSKSWYQSIQHTNTRDCEELPSSQREECLEKSEKSYEEYHREKKVAEKEWH